jgi:hypothetical protein
MKHFFMVSADIAFLGYSACDAIAVGSIPSVLFSPYHGTSDSDTMKLCRKPNQCIV